MRKMKIDEFNALPLSEKEKIMRNMRADDLLKMHDYLRENFNPVDDSYIESYGCTIAIIVERMERGGK